MNIRKAFTMSEALIVLGIIAVIATLSVLAVQNAKPDPEIVMFKKAYKTTQDIIQNMYYDKELCPNATDPMEVAYTFEINSNPIPGNTLGFFNLNGDGNYKFAEAFITRLNPLSHGKASTKRNGVDVFTAKTADGIYWEIEDHFSEHEVSGKVNAKTYITVYLDGADTDSCSYDSRSCPRPNKFIFELTNSGKITPLVSADKDADIDPIACSFLRLQKVNKFDKIPKDSSNNSCFGY